ncbi:FAD-dependent oxidoreductase [Actinomycetota bacterium Odt1-20B]
MTNSRMSRRRFTTSTALSVSGLATAGALSGTEADARTRSRLPAEGEAADSRSTRPVCRDVARALLMLDDQDKPLRPLYKKTLLEAGLPRSRAGGSKRILVIGAGVAGLTAAYLLKEAGHDVTVIEANANRAGGRIKTFRTGGHEHAEQPFADPKQYAEAGAMRIPDTHELVIGLIDQLGLTRRMFYLTDVGRDEQPAARTWLYVNGVRMRRVDYAKNPRKVNQSFGVPQHLWDVPASKILKTVLDPVRDEFSTEGPDGVRVDKPLDECLEGWARVIERFGEFSMYRFLTEHARLDSATIDLLGTLENLTSRLPLAFLHSFMSAALIGPQTRFNEISGGTAALADALLARVRDLVHFNRRATRIAYDAEAPAGSGVWVDTVSEDGAGPSVREQFTADRVIIAIPFSGLRQLPIRPRISYGKRRAVIELHYDAATKVLLEFSRRWWEMTESDWKRELDSIRHGLYEEYRNGKAATDGSLLAIHPSVPRGWLKDGQRLQYAARRSAEKDQPEATSVIGGGSVSDNSNRFMFHPSHPVPGSAGGVVLAAYNWADDALRWDCLDDDARYPHALRGLQDVYGQRIEVFYTGAGQTQSWARDPYAYGEASVLLPGQHTELLPHIARPEGPLHFAGDHTSLKPAWIEGALESAVRTALEAHHA